MPTRHGPRHPRPVLIARMQQQHVSWQTKMATFCQPEILFDFIRAFDSFVSICSVEFCEQQR